MKRIIQICSLLGLLVMFGGVSANAQAVYGSDVKIPFAFTVGDKSYDPGHFIVKVSKLPSGLATLSIQDTGSDDIQTIIINTSGDQPSKELKLVFEVIDGNRILSKVHTPNQAYAVLKTKNTRIVQRAELK